MNLHYSSFQYLFDFSLLWELCSDQALDNTLENNIIDLYDLSSFTAISNLLECVDGDSFTFLGGKSRSRASISYDIRVGNQEKGTCVI